MENTKIVWYESKDGKTQLEVNLENETVWLNQQQMETLFHTDRTSIAKHIKNIYKTGELEEKATCAKFAQVRQEGKRQVKRSILYYNLDMIISVGYRVNSYRGTQFRIWANQLIKQYLVEGYAINEQRLQEQQKNLKQLEATIQFLSKTINQDALELSEAKGFLDIITLYTKSFITLNQYDSDNLDISNLEYEISYPINYKEASSAIRQLRSTLMDKKEATALFGNEKDNSFEGILNGILQTFDGFYLYPTVEEQAAHLLYFIIKNHPFSDGNKRIGAFMFVWFLEKNKHHLDHNGQYKINENALVALALLTAQSAPSQKDLMIKLIINLIRP